MPVNEHLRQHRLKRNLRQQDVADEVGAALSTVQRWERGVQPPTAYYLAKLCQLFGVSAQELGLLEELLPSAPPENEATDTATSLSHLANLSTQQGKHAQAEILYEQALLIYQ